MLHHPTRSHHHPPDSGSSQPGLHPPRLPLLSHSSSAPDYPSHSHSPYDFGRCQWVNNPAAAANSPPLRVDIANALPSTRPTSACVTEGAIRPAPSSSVYAQVRGEGRSTSTRSGGVDEEVNGRLMGFLSQRAPSKVRQPSGIGTSILALPSLPVFMNPHPVFSVVVDCQKLDDRQKWTTSALSPPTNPRRLILKMEYHLCDEAGAYRGRYSSRTLGGGEGSVPIGRLSTARASAAELSS
ncbi:hypothetical protein NMY22_g3795 [Coprinellus aureogranulatus]|nr:hypothetical protein NMY22_g3795 [Coprinellus aureogranulatus]